MSMLRGRQRCRPRALTLAQVRRLGRYATHRCVCGCVLEYAEGRFWVVRAGSSDAGRAAFEESRLPRGPWHHHSLCDCEVCREE
jgi:hypothetical protein